MNRDLLESQWTQIRDILREKFSNLTDEDIRQINGRYDQLVAKLQQKYGYSREEAEERIRNWNFDRFASAQNRSIPAREDRYYQEDKLRRDDSGSLLKWIFGLGIPLLLLGLYFFNPFGTETASSPMVGNEQMMSATPADTSLISELRNAYLAQNISGVSLQDIRIAARNGIVTLSGTVPSREALNQIVNTTQRFPGVRQVINNLQVR